MKGEDMNNFYRYLKKHKPVVLLTIIFFVLASCSNSPKQKNPNNSSSENLPDNELARYESDKENQSIDGQSSTHPLTSSAMMSELSKDELDQKADLLEKSLQRLEAEVQAIPKELFNLEALADKLGSDPIEIFEWVRDKTYLVPYRGLLRGAKGVLMDRLGNSLDRSLLLFELLKMAGHNTRLAHGTLPSAQIRKVSQRIHSLSLGKKESSEKSFRTLEKSALAYCERYQLDQTIIMNELDLISKAHKRFSKDINDRIKTQIRVISDTLAEYEVRIKSDDNESLYPALEDHWWVQLEKEGAWTDLDPSFPELQAGQVLTETEDTYDPENLDEDLFHRITIRVVVERWEEGTLKQDTVMEHTLHPSQIIGTHITLRHAPLDWPPEDLDISEAPDSLEKIKEIILKKKEWLPVLIIGSNQITASSFMNTGEINETPGEKSKGSGARGITGGFVRALTGGEDEKKESQLTAEWIEYEIHSAGDVVLTTRRQIYDFIGPAARLQDEIEKPPLGKDEQFKRELILFLGENNIITSVCRISPQFFANLLAKNLLDNRAIFTEILRQKDLVLINEILDNHQEDIASIPVDLYLFAAARFEFNSTHSVYIDRPNIFSSRRYPNLHPSGTSNLRFEFDIVTNQVATLSDNSEVAFMNRLEQGIFDTNIEALLLKKGNKLVRNTSEIFLKSLQKGNYWAIIQEADDLSWQKAKIPLDSRILIEQELAAGYIVLVPEKPVLINGDELVGWWRIHPQRGDTLGFMETGAGQTLTEYALMVVKGAVPAIWAWFCKQADWNRDLCSPCVLLTLSGIWAFLGFAGAMISETVTMSFMYIFLFEAPWIWGVYDTIGKLDDIVRLAHDCFT